MGGCWRWVVLDHGWAGMYDFIILCRAYGLKKDSRSSMTAMEYYAKVLAAPAGPETVGFA